MLDGKARIPRQTKFTRESYHEISCESRKGVHMDKTVFRSILANALFEQADKSEIDGVCIHDNPDGTCGIKFVPVKKEAE